MLKYQISVLIYFVLFVTRSIGADDSNPTTTESVLDETSTTSDDQIQTAVSVSGGDLEEFEEKNETPTESVLSARRANENDANSSGGSVEVSDEDISGVSEQTDRKENDLHAEKETYVHPANPSRRQLNPRDDEASNRNSFGNDPKEDQNNEFSVTDESETEAQEIVMSDAQTNPPSEKSKPSDRNKIDTNSKEGYSKEDYSTKVIGKSSKLEDNSHTETFGNVQSRRRSKSDDRRNVQVNLANENTNEQHGLETDHSVQIKEATHPPPILRQSKLGNSIESTDAVENERRLKDRSRGFLKREHEIKRFENKNTPENYSFLYESANGQKRQEKGIMRVADNGAQVYDITGQYSYIGPDGLEYIVKYTADENGFRPLITIRSV